MQDIEKIKINTNKLLASIKNVIDSDLSKADKSREIMALLRKEYIWVKNTYINTFEDSAEVTINPNSEEVKLELSEGDKEGLEKDEFTRIYAYSFGPWNTHCDDKYFDDDQLRIVWLLKEPLLKDITQMRAKKEGVNQEKDFRSWKPVVEDDPKKNGTKAKLIYYTQSLLLALSDIDEKVLEEIKDEKLKRQIGALKNEKLSYRKGIDSDDVENQVMNNVMNHICILEVNHFPGLAFNPKNENSSKDEIIENWANITRATLREFVKFYAPSIIIGGFTLQHFSRDNHDEIIKIRNPKNICQQVRKGNFKIDFIGSKIVKFRLSKSGNYVYEGIDTQEDIDKKIYIVDSYHPTARYGYFKTEFGSMDAETIIKLTNGAQMT